MEVAVKRSRMSHPGGGLPEKQDRFIRLIERGVSKSEACRLVVLTQEVADSIRS